MNGKLLFMCGLWLVYVILLLPLYLKKQSQNGLISAMPYKLSLSLLFCILGGLAVLKQGGSSFSILIICGLIASLVGDYYLIYIQEDEPKFIKGIFYFAVAHLFYLTAMVRMVGVSVVEIIGTLVLLVGLFVVKKITKPLMGKAELPMSLYTVLVTFMAVKALSMAFMGNSPLTVQWVFSLGAFLFLASDLCLGVWRYILPEKILSQIVAILYFIGQMLIATASYYQ